MRETKFRAKYKDPDIKNWAYGSLNKSNWDIACFKYKLSEFFKLLEQGFLDPETVGQFTGLKSKSGVEIYKGNTVKSPDGLRKYLVMWNEKQGCYYLKGIGKAWTMHQHIAWKEFEVVGENPELMEKPK